MKTENSGSSQVTGKYPFLSPVCQHLSYNLMGSRLAASVALVIMLVFCGSIFGAANDLGNAKTLYNKGLESYRSDDMPAAIEAWSQALSIYKTIKGTERDQAGCYKNIGIVLGDIAKYEEAIASHEKALSIYRAIPDTKRDQASCYLNIGLPLNDMGKYGEAIARYEQALGIFRTIVGAERQQAICFQNTGVAFNRSGKYEEAIAQQEQALAIYQKIKGTEREQARCYGNIGIALWNMAKYEEAITQQERALEIYKTIKGTERDWASCYLRIGLAIDDMGKHEEAIISYERALSIFKTISGTERDQAVCYVNIGVALCNMAKYEDCIAKQKHALSMYTMIKGTERNQAECYVNIGVAFRHMGKYEEAITRQEQALSIFKTIKGTEREQATCYRNIGVTLRSLGRCKEAIAGQKKAIAIYKKIKGTELDRVACYGNIGWALIQTSQYSRAIASFNQAGRDWWWISQGLGKAYHFRSKQGDDLKAIESFLEAVRRAEQKRKYVMAFEHRAGIFEEPTQVFSDFVSLLVRLTTNQATINNKATGPLEGFANLMGTLLGKGNNKKKRLNDSEIILWAEDPNSDTALLEAAFHYADRGKGRAMEDALRDKVTLKATRPDTNLLIKDKELSLQISKLTSLRDELSQAEVGRRERLTQQVNELQQQRNMLEVELKRTALGGYVAPEFRKPMEMAKELPSQTAVLQYSVGEKESWLLILTREEVTAHHLGAETSALPELLLHQEATLGQLTQAWKERPGKIGLDGLVRLARMRAEDLSRKPGERHNLINANQERAILERLGETALPSSALAEVREKEIRHLLVIPDGSLHYVPFAMLRVESDSKASKQYLVEQYSISYTPAMTTLETIRKQAQEWQSKRKLQRRSLLAFANPSFKDAVLPSPDDISTK